MFGLDFRGGDGGGGFIDGDGGESGGGLCVVFMAGAKVGKALGSNADTLLPFVDSFKDYAPRRC